MNSFLNERDRYVLHLFPKAATTTFKTWFWYDLEGRHDEFITDPPPFPADRDGNRLQVHRLVNPLAVRNPKVGSDYKIFTVVRNPFSRLVSAYWSVIRSEAGRRKVVAKLKTDELGENFADFIHLLAAGKLGVNPHWAPMSRLQGPAGEILRVENLAEDFKKMCRALGKKEGALPRYYSGTRGSKRPADYYTEELADIVRHLYAADFERFGYSTEVPGTGASERRRPQRRGRIDGSEGFESLDPERLGGSEPGQPLDLPSTAEFERGRGYYRQVVRQWGLDGLGSVLDVACGHGIWSLFLAEVNERVYGVDRDPGRVAFAARLSDHLGFDNIRHEVADPAAIPGEEASFDGAWLLGLLRLHDPAGALREIHRLLRPGGVLVLAGVMGAGRMLKWFFDGYRQGGLSADKTRTALDALKEGPRLEDRPTYTTPETLREVLEAHGFELPEDHPVLFGSQPVVADGGPDDSWARELADLPAFAAHLEADPELAARFAERRELARPFPLRMNVRAKKR